MKLEKCLFLIVIILISLICISSVSATEVDMESTVEGNAINDIAYEEVQSVDGSNVYLLNSNDCIEDDLILDEDMSYSESEDVLPSDVDGSKFAFSLGDDVLPSSMSESKLSLSSEDRDESKLSLSSRENDVLFKSNEAVVTVTPSAETYKSGSDVRLTVGLTGIDGIALDGIVILTIGNNQYVANVTSGSVNVVISNLENDTYTVFAEFLGNDLYESSINNDASFVVNKSKKVTADVSANNITYGETVTINVNNLCDIDGKALSNYGGYQLVGPQTPYGSFFVRKGKGSFSVSGLPAGNYSAYVVFGNNVGGSYEFENYVVNFTVNKATPVLGANANNISFGENGTVNISVDGVKSEKLNETLLITLNGETYGVVDSINGMANLVIPELSVGNYTVGIWFGGINSTNYNWAEYACSFNVNNAIVNLEVNGSTVEYGNPSTVKVAATNKEANPIAGTVIVKVAYGENLAYDVVELNDEGVGQAAFRLDLLGAGLGTFNVTATYIENDKYSAVENADANITLKESTRINAEVSVNEPSTEEDVIITINLTNAMGTALAVSEVNVTIGNGEPVPYAVSEDGTVNIGKLPAGPTDIFVSFNDGYHDSVSESKTVIVSNLISDTDITIRVNNISYGDVAVIEFSLSDVNGVPLSGVLNVTVGDEVYSVNVTGGSGLLSIENLSADTYPVVANFKGNGTYAPSTGTGSFNVAKNATKIIYENMTTHAVDYYVDGKVGEWFVWRLVDANGNPLKNAPMQIGFNGVVYDEKNGIVTDEDGYARLQINLMTAFTYTFAVSFLGDENHNASFVVAKIDVLKQVPTITVPNKYYKASAKTKTLQATFKSNQGTPISGKVIKFTVNGKTYSAKTDAKGVAKVNVSLSKKGTYKVTINYAGSGTYDKVSKKATLKLT